MKHEGERALEGQGRDPEPAQIDAAFAGGDLDRATELVEAAGQALFLGRLQIPLDRLEGWLDRLRPWVQERPWLLYYQAWIWSGQRRHALASVALRRVEDLVRREAATPGRAQALIAVKLAQGVVAERDANLVAAREAFAAARQLLGESRYPEPWIDPADAERWRSCDPSGAAAFYLEAIPAFAGAGEPLPLARCIHNLSMELLRRGEPAMARRAARRAVELKRGLGPESALANSLNTLGIAERWLGLYSEARASLMEARQLAAASGNRLIAAYATNNLAEVERDARGWAKAQELYEESLAAKEALHDEYGLAYGLRSLATLKRWTGDLASARELIERACRLREPAADPLEAAELRLETGLVLAGQGDLEAARPVLREAALLAEGVDAKGVATLAHVALALQDGDDDALRLARTSAERFRFAPLVEREVEAQSRAVSGPSAGPHLTLLPAAAADQLRAWVLGEFRLELAGRPVDLDAWRSKRAGELVRVLVATRARWATRDELIEWLWPDAERPEGSLNAAVNAARRGLERVGGPGPWILRQGERYRLAGVAWVDADVLAARYAAARAAHARGDREQAWVALAQARELYVGEAYAADRYAEWAAPERARLAELVQLVREGSAALALELGRLEDTILLALDAIDAEPTRETAYQLLIRAYLARGDRAAAVHALARCRSALQEELGVAPSPVTEALLRN